MNEEEQQIDQEEQDFQDAMLEEEEGIIEGETDAIAPEEPEPEPEPEPEFDAADEIKRLRAALEKTNGTYGSQLANINAQLKTLTAPRQTPDAPEPAKVAVTPERLARLKSEFPELAELLAQDLSEILTAPAQAGNGEDLAEIRQAIQSGREQSKQREARMLRREHPDWEDVARYSPDANGLIRWNDPAFGQWVGAQDEEVQNQILNSDDALELAEYITAFKQTLVKAKPKQNLNKAIQPRSQPGTVRPSSLDEEERLYREEMAREEY